MITKRELSEVQFSSKQLRIYTGITEKNFQRKFDYSNIVNAVHSLKVIQKTEQRNVYSSLFVVKLNKWAVGPIFAVTKVSSKYFVVPFFVLPLTSGPRLLQIW